MQALNSLREAVTNWYSGSVQNKMLAVVLTALTLLYAVTLSVVYHFNRDELLRGAIREAETTTDVLAVTLFRTFELGEDAREIQSYLLGALRRKSNLLRISVLDRSLTFISSTDESLISQRPTGGAYAALLQSPGDSFETVAAGDQIRVLLPISAGGSYATGLIELYADLAAYRRQLTKLRFGITASGAVIFLAMIIVLKLIARSLTEPIRRLYQGMSQANQGDLGVQVTATTEDEIGYATRTFNTLISSIQESNKTLRENRDHLEALNHQLLELNESSQRFVPLQFLHLLRREDITQVKLGASTVLTLSVLFIDIRRFTSLSESMKSDQVLQFLNDLLAHILPAIERRGGFVDKYIGDAIMALFPERIDDALLAAVEIQTALADYNRDRQTGSKIVLGMGVNSGELIMGTIGSQHRLDTTVIGATVNLASRLEKLSKEFNDSILLPKSLYSFLTEETRAALQFRDLGPVAIRGLAQPVELLGLAPQAAT